MDAVDLRWVKKLFCQFSKRWLSGSILLLVLAGFQPGYAAVASGGCTQTPIVIYQANATMTCPAGTASASQTVVTAVSSSNPDITEYNCCVANQAAANNAQTAAANLPAPGTVTGSSYVIPGTAVTGTFGSNVSMGTSQVTGSIGAAQISGALPSSTGVDSSLINSPMTKVTIPGSNVTSAVASTSSVACTNSYINGKNNVVALSASTSWSNETDTNGNVDHVYSFPLALQAMSSGGTICPGNYTVHVTCTSFSVWGCCGGDYCGWHIGLLAGTPPSTSSYVIGKDMNSNYYGTNVVTYTTFGNPPACSGTSAASGSQASNCGQCSASVSNNSNPWYKCGDGLAFTAQGTWDTHASPTITGVTWGLEDCSWIDPGATCTIDQLTLNYAYPY